MKCLICQFGVVSDIEKQKQRVQAIMERFVKDKSDIILFPELFLTGYYFDQNTIYEKFQAQEGIFFLGEMAERHDCYVLGGIITKKGEKFYNSAVVVSPKAEVILNYRKVHLYKEFNEKQLFQAGTEVGTFSLPLKDPTSGQKSVRASVLVCYDLVITRREPAWLNLIKESNPRILFVIAQWPKDEEGVKDQGIKSWRILNSRLSREVKCPVIGVNRYGKAEDLKDFGSIFFAGYSGYFDFSVSPTPLKEVCEGEQVFQVEVKDL
ncbi:hypothetical protein IIA15_02925 [candidate division TA06 bacterium]|nr:hypothetical protein [candidate division TA06 bacterium]